MKKPMILILLGAALAVPIETSAWVAVGHAGYGGACWHSGWGCGGVSTGTAVAAGAAGLVAGAAIGSAAARANQPTVVVAPSPVVVAPAPAVVVPSAPAIGTIYYTLPAGAQATTINGIQYYVHDNAYYRPYFGNNGVYYQVAPNPA